MKTKLIHHNFLIKSIVLLLFASSIAIACSSDSETSDSEVDDTIGQDDGDDKGNDNGTGNDNGNDNGNSTDFSNDLVSKSLKFTDVYFYAGEDNTIQMDNQGANNPGLDKLPKAGKSMLAADIGVDEKTAAFISVSGQIINDDEDVLDLPNGSNATYDDNFEATVITMIRPSDIPDGVEPNARIEWISNFTFSPNGQQGQDNFENSIGNIDSGSFKVISNTGALGQTSTGEDVTDVTFTFDDSAFKNYFADNAVIIQIDVDLNNETNVFDITDEIFLQNSADVYIVETVNLSPNMSAPQVIRPYHN